MNQKILLGFTKNSITRPIKVCFSNLPPRKYTSRVIMPCEFSHTIYYYNSTCCYNVGQSRNDHKEVAQEVKHLLKDMIKKIVLGRQQRHAKSLDRSRVGKCLQQSNKRLIVNTVMLRAVNRCTVQFWTFLAKYRSIKFLLYKDSKNMKMCY